MVNLASAVEIYDPVVSVIPGPYHISNFRRIKKRMHPEFELGRPNKFNVSELKRKFHPDQEAGLYPGLESVYCYLRNEPPTGIGLLKHCLIIGEILAIKARGVDFFRNYFPGEMLIAWASASESHNGNSFVPYIIEGNNEIIDGWQMLIVGMSPKTPIVHHPIR